MLGLTTAPGDPLSRPATKTAASARRDNWTIQRSQFGRRLLRESSASTKHHFVLPPEHQPPPLRHRARKTPQADCAALYVTLSVASVGAGVELPNPRRNVRLAERMGRPRARGNRTSRAAPVRPSTPLARHSPLAL